MDEARRAFEESLAALDEDSPHAPARAQALIGLAECATADGDHEGVQGLIGEAIGIARTWNSVLLESRALRVRAENSVSRGASEEASRDIRQALALTVDTGARALVPPVLEHLALVVGDDAEAARILGISLAMRERMATPIHPIDQAAHDDVVLGLRASPGAESFDRAWEAGRALEEESALREFKL